MTNIHEKDSRKKRAWTYAVSVCGGTKVNYYANANQRSTREKKEQKGTMIIFPGPRYYRKNYVRVQKETVGNPEKCKMTF